MSDLLEAIRQAVAARLQARLGPGYDQAAWSKITDDDRSAVYRAIVEELIGRDPEALVTAIVNAVADDRLSSDDTRDILLAWARSAVGQDDAAQLAVDALADGVITGPEAAGIAVTLAAQRVTDPRAKAALIKIRDGQFDTDVIWSALIEYLVRDEGTQRIAGIFEQAVGDGRISQPEVLQLLAAWAAASGQADLSDLLSAGDLRQAIVGWLAGRIAARTHTSGKGVEAFVRALESGQWLAALAALLGMLDQAFGRDLIESYANGQLKEYLIGQLARQLQSAGVAPGDTDVVAQAVADLLSGALVLFASSPESDAPELQAPTDIAGFRQIRGVIYLAQLAVFGDRIVPTDPMAPPHVFLAARIRFSSKLQGLVPAAASEESKKRFCNTVTAMLDKHFEGPGYRPYRQDDLLAVDLDALAGKGEVRLVFYNTRNRFPGDRFPASVTATN